MNINKYINTHIFFSYTATLLLCLCYEIFAFYFFCCNNAWNSFSSFLVVAGGFCLYLTLDIQCMCAYLRIVWKGEAKHLLHVCNM